MRISNNFANKVSTKMKAGVLSLAILPGSVSPALAKDIAQFSTPPALTGQSSVFGSKILEPLKKSVENMKKPLGSEKKLLYTEADSNATMKLKVQLGEKAQALTLIKVTDEAFVYKIDDISTLGFPPNVLSDIDKVFVAKFLNHKFKPAYRIDYKPKTITNDPAKNNIPYVHTVTDYVGGGDDIRDEYTYLEANGLHYFDNVTYDSELKFGVLSKSVSNDSEEQNSYYRISNGETTQVSGAEYRKLFNSLLGFWNKYGLLLGDLK